VYCTGGRYAIENARENKAIQEISETLSRKVAKLSEMMYTYIQLLMAHQQEVLQW